ncbi:MAG: sulfite exporter TauE/SafE family protein [Bacteroidia bacterium]|nr:sulfite exporter TauE/SafE family protein [Bacteroidia bacterium]MDW8014597.1 sulfite exporter TauE/SafE family protein [Bacteroidia bacterium]
MEVIIGITLGLLAGILSGLVGIGGGTVIIPLLVLGWGYTQHEAQGTALMAFAFPVFGAAAWNYYRFRRVRIRLALLTAVALALTSYLMAWWVQGIESQLLTRIFAVFLILTSGYTLWRSFSPLKAPQASSPSLFRETMVGIGVGSLTGLIKGLTGLGGGVVIVPLLRLWGGLDQHTAQGTSLFIMTLPVAILPAIPYWQNGQVRWPLVLGLVIGLLIGSYRSSALAQKVSGPLLARIFAGTIAIMGVVLLLK